MRPGFAGPPTYRLLAPASVRRPATYDHRVGPLVVARPLERGLAPFRLGLATDRRLALAAAVRVVARVHHRAANGRSLAHVTAATRLADDHVLVIDVADLAERGDAIQV